MFSAITVTRKVGRKILYVNVKTLHSSIQRAEHNDIADLPEKLQS